MRRLIVLILLVSAGFVFSACRSAPKSSARLYEGDGPSITYSESHAGGPLDTR
jgi:hypothetical protein